MQNSLYLSFFQKVSNVIKSVKIKVDKFKGFNSIEYI